MADDKKPLRILLIDDDEVDTRIIERNLQKSGLPLELDKIVDPEIGNDLARTGTYECMLMDFRYPSGNAFEIFSELLQTPCSRRPPVVLMTNMGSEGVAAQSIQLGAQEYLSKSEISPWTLRRLIESACEKGQLQRQIERRDQELLRMSFYDSLTGLPNRQLFQDRLGQLQREASRHNQFFAVLMMDLDLFKNVNDTFGHDAGDELLTQVAGRLTGSIRDSDTVARIGGDEFAAILPAIESPGDSRLVVDKILASMSEPFVIKNNSIHVEISIGVSTFPEGGSDGETLMKHADIAMYEAKKSTSGVAHYCPDSSQTFEQNAIISHDLKQAIEQDELQVHFQPQVRLSDRALIGAEALVRWDHPEFGPIGPARFIPMAERTRSIEKLTLGVLEQTLVQCRDWHARGIPISASVNLSARVLHCEDIVALIKELVERYEVAPEMLCLEITETAIMQSPAMAKKILSALSDFAIRIAIDDFGTGYSSLKYLQQMPIREIKIDRDFVMGLHRLGPDWKIVKSVIALGKSLDLQVVAEGVENETVWNILVSSDCDIAQGYHIGRPQAADAFERWRLGWEAVRSKSA